MKTLILALTLSSLQAMAAKVPVAEFDENDVRSESAIFGHYGINEEMGRAWAEITLLSRFGYDDNNTYVRAQVPGLSIVGSDVVLNADGQNVVCAVVRSVGIFRTRVAKETKNCRFVTDVKKVQVDDGFHVRTVKKFVLSLETVE